MFGSIVGAVIAAPFKLAGVAVDAAEDVANALVDVFTGDVTFRRNDTNVLTEIGRDLNDWAKETFGE